MENASGTFSAVTTSLTATAGDVTGFMLSVVGAALTVFALQWGVRKGLRFFKSLT